MEEKNLDDVFADVRKEGEDPFNPQGETTPSDSQPEDKQEGKKPVEGDNTDETNIPFHKHPRWIEIQNELKAAKEREEAREREIAELRELKEQFSKPINTRIPDWFVTLYGDNPEAWEKYREYNEQEREEMKREILEAQEQERVKAIEQEKYWDNWVEGEMGKLETKGYKFDREELAKIMLQMRPTDTQGNLDFEAGYQIYNALNSNKSTVNPVTQAKKRVADAITKSTRGEPSKKDYMTPQDLRSKSWDQLIN